MRLSVALVLAAVVIAIMAGARQGGCAERHSEPLVVKMNASNDLDGDDGHDHPVENGGHHRVLATN